MPLYSIVSLMIALFGASYTVITGFKNLFDAYVKKCGEDADLKYEELKPLKLPQTLAEGDRIRNCIRTARIWWIITFSAPIIVFWFFAFGITFWAVEHWQDLGQKDVPGPWPQILFCVALFNIMCSLGNVLALVMTRRFNLEMIKHCGFAQEKRLREQIQAVPQP